MPEKKVFGPQRKPVQSPAIQRTPEENMQMLEQMRATRQQLESGDDAAVPVAPPRQRLGEEGMNPMQMLAQQMPPEVQEQLRAAREDAQRRAMAAEARKNDWIEVQDEAGPPIQETLEPPPAIPGSLTDISGLQRPPGRRTRTAAAKQRPHRKAPSQINMSPALRAVVEKIEPVTAKYEPVELPSRGVFYDGTDGPRNGLIHLRPMTGEEEQVLATQRLVNSGAAMDMIFKKCMQESQFDPATLLSVDRQYMMIHLRGISYTTQYDVDISCPQCRSKFGYSLNLDDMWIDMCPMDFGPDSLADVLPVTGLQFNYRLSRGYDETELQQYIRHQLMERGAESTDDTLTFRMVQLLDDVEGITDKQELEFLVAKLPGGDSAYLRQTVTEPPFGVDSRVDIECQNPACGVTFGIALPVAADFFFPRPKKGNRTRATS